MLTDVVIANKSYTKLNLSEDKVVDNIALKVIKQDCPNFLLPIKAIEIDGELELRYELLEGIRLCYNTMKMSKNEFVVLLKNMLTPFKICSDWFLDYHNILMDANYILVGKGGRPVRYLYLPVPEYAHSDAEIMDFFWNIVLKAEIEDDPRYAMNLLRVLKGDNANLMTLLDYVSKEEGALEQTPDSAQEGMGSAAPAARPFQEVSPVVRPVQPAGDTGAVFRPATPAVNVSPTPEKEKASGGTDYKGSTGGAARPGQMPKEFGKQDVEGQLVGSLFGDDEEDEPVKKGKKAKTPKQPKAPKEKKESGLFDLFKGKNKNDGAKSSTLTDGGQGAIAGGAAVDRPAPETGSVQGGWQSSGDYEKEDVTEIVGEEEVNDGNLLKLSLEDGAGYNCPKYIEIDLSKGFATVGRLDKNGQKQSDFNFDASLSFVSRRHFRVEKAGDGWRIIDLESKNGTFLNGEQLSPNIAYPLRSGDRIMISSKNRLTYRVI
ncbi:MAG: FHA domain-containing protein [Candidatus Gastranaerophilales bacterium]|nr:FHA domain-containing protein [Candidatus Gastranaerophilales bacterium]